MSWQLLTAISVLTFSISVLLQRLLLHKDKSDPIAYVVMFQGLVAIIITIYALIIGFQMPDIKALWLPMLATFVLFGIGHVIYAHTLRLVEASIFAILFATYAIWVMLAGLILFNESITGWQILGSLLLFASIGLLVERRGQLKLDKSTWLGLLTGVFYGLAVVAWVYVGRRADTASWTAISFAGPTLVVLLANPKVTPKLKTFLKGDKLNRLILLGIFFSIQALTQLEAYRKGNASLIAPLLQTNIIVTILLAIIFLHERTRLWHKATAALVCFLGVLLIV